MGADIGRLKLFVADVRAPQEGKTASLTPISQIPFKELSISILVWHAVLVQQTYWHPPNLRVCTYEITCGGVSALTSQLKGRWVAKGEGFASAALCQRTACDADVLGTQLKVAKSFFR
jgi:hypothetical protein